MNIEELSITNDLTIEDFLTPISAESPSGQSLKESEVYTDIQQARAFDDPSLPRGVWDHDLKRSDWHRVRDLCQSSLLEKTKDIQVAIWFLESQLNLQGIASLPTSLLLLSKLTDEFWDDVHPVMQDSDTDYRTNLFVWMNDKLIAPLRQITIAETLTGEVFLWLDWGRAALLNDAQSALPEFKDKNTKAIKLAISQTHIDYYKNLCQDINDSLSALDFLDSVLAEKLALAAPSMNNLKNLLRTMLETIDGLTGATAIAAEEETTANQSAPEVTQDEAQPNIELSAVTDRQRAYEMLAEAAEYLSRDDPHSPVPYLVLRAIEWGQLTTAELYDEIFIQNEGRLNIFELLGIEKGEGR